MSQTEEKATSTASNTRAPRIARIQLSFPRTSLGAGALCRAVVGLAVGELALRRPGLDRVFSRLRKRLLIVRFPLCPG